MAEGRYRWIQAARVCASMVLVVSLGACSSPTSPLEGITASEGSRSFKTAGSGIPDWVLHPQALPAGLQGQNNCTYAHEGQWDAHPEGGCWERPGPDGWTRQQTNKNHVDSLPICGGGPGDTALLRVCRAGGEDQISPCDGNTTGPRGCALCVRVVTCHQP